MKMFRFIAAGLAAALSLTAIGSTAYAAGGGTKPPSHEWHHAGPFGTYDRHAIQRGFQVYQEICASCHALGQMSFRNLGQRGGPFEDGNFPNPNDNPIVMQIAASYQIMDGPNDDGDMFERAGIPADTYPSPFENEQQARASNGGAYPPDLSLIVRARGYGEDYIYGLLTGYHDAPEGYDLAPGQYYNDYFPGNAIAMAPPIMDDMITYADGTEATMEQMAEDVTVFLTWVGDPHMEARKQTGWMVLIYLFIFTIIVYLAYRQIWANVKH
ncbi:MAG: cytochrome c1 [Alphaproteobacteria bacterium]|nr:cytochrome c1 [Alphaproteobacteria bacterium]